MKQFLYKCCIDMQYYLQNLNISFVIFHRLGTLGQFPIFRYLNFEPNLVFHDAVGACIEKAIFPHLSDSGIRSSI